MGAIKPLDIATMIYLTPQKTIIAHEVVELLIPLSWSLFQVI